MPNIAFASGGVPHPELVLPITQSTGTPIFQQNTNSIKFWYGAIPLAFFLSGATTASLDANIPNGVTISYQVDGGTATNISGAGRTTYPLSLPDNGKHLITITQPSNIGPSKGVEYFNVVVDAGGFASKATYANGAPAFGPALCTLNDTATDKQVWIDAGGDAYIVDPADYVDCLKFQYQIEQDIRWKGRGGSVWIETNRYNGDVFAVRIDGQTYPPQTPVIVGTGQCQWLKVIDSSVCAALADTTVDHDITVAIVSWGNNSGTTDLTYIAGVMMGGAGASINTSAITLRGRMVVSGNSIGQGCFRQANRVPSFTDNSQNWTYLVANHFNLATCNLSILSTTFTDHNVAASGYTNAGVDKGSGTGSQSYRLFHTGVSSLPSLRNPSYVTIFADEGGTNDEYNVISGSQTPLLPTSAPAVAAATIPTFTATGGSTITATTSAGFTSNHLGQTVICLSAANPANVGEARFIAAVAGTTITFDKAWPAAISSTDTFEVHGANYKEQLYYRYHWILRDPQYSQAKVLFVNVFERYDASQPVPNIAVGGGATAYQISDIRAVKNQVAAQLAAEFPGRVLVSDMTGIGPNGSTSYYMDAIHLNAAGNALAANKIIADLSAPITLTGTGISSHLAFGVGSVSAGSIQLVGEGIASSLAFGSGIVHGGSIVLTGTGIGSHLAFGEGAVELADGTIILQGTGIASSFAFGAGSVSVGSQVQVVIGYHLLAGLSGASLSLVNAGGSRIAFQAYQEDGSAVVDIDPGLLRNNGPYYISDGGDTLIELPQIIRIDNTTTFVAVGVASAGRG